MVIGSGPAGMEAARIARLRGHDVSIWERDPELGGKLDVASRAPSKTTVLDFRDYQARMLRSSASRCTRASRSTRRRFTTRRPTWCWSPTGADALVRPIPGIGGPNVIDAQEILYDRVAVAPGERFAVIGGSATGCETAEWLVAAGAKVTIVEMLPTVGQGIELITRRHLLADLKGEGHHDPDEGEGDDRSSRMPSLYESTEDGRRRDRWRSSGSRPPSAGARADRRSPSS